VELIRAHWAEILRIVASIRAGTVAPSVIMQQLASYPRQNGVAAALRELGKLERRLFTRNCSPPVRDHPARMIAPPSRAARIAASAVSPCSRPVAMTLAAAA
jgi:hypothetical protein